MMCARCSSENLPSARFCAACGGSMAVVTVGAEAPYAPPPYYGPPVAAVAVACRACGRAMRPAPYFSRGVNVAKGLALMIPFSFVGPVLFFFLRKDRMICGFCNRLMSGEIAVPLLNAFSPDGRALVPLGGGLAPYESEDSVPVLEHESRRHRSRAWTWGAIAGGLGAIGALMAGTGDLHSAVGFMVVATPPALGAWLATVRSRAFWRRASARRGREQRARVLELARAAGGRLNVTAVATDLRVELGDAEAILNAMVDGHRIEMEVDDAGRITYLFTELGGR